MRRVMRSADCCSDCGLHYRDSDCANVNGVDGRTEHSVGRTIDRDVGGTGASGVYRRRCTRKQWVHFRGRPSDDFH